MTTAIIEKHLAQQMKDKLKHEQERLREYGGECSMGRCAQSRIHLLEELLSSHKGTKS